MRKDDWIELDFPAEPQVQITPPPGLAKALGVKPKYVGKNRFDYLVEVDSEETVCNLKPDFALLKELPVRGVIVTSIAASHEYDFVSRFLLPRSGSMRIRLQALLIAVLVHSGKSVSIKMSLLPARLHFAVGSCVFE